MLLRTGPISQKKRNIKSLQIATTVPGSAGRAPAVDVIGGLAVEVEEAGSGGGDSWVEGGTQQRSGRPTDSGTWSR